MVRVSEDDWAWAHEDKAAPEPPVDVSRVVAVLVVHNGAPWLARMLVSLARLQERPGRILAVNAGSTDETADLLGKAHGEGLLDAVIRTDDAPGFGACVNRALEELPDDADPAWLWLLHDDVVLRRGALTGLVDVGASDPQVGIVVPKLLLPKLRNYPDRVAEIGQSITASGRRITSPRQNVDVGDLDQQQLESLPVLGGSTAGMLVRWEAWCQLGGLDEAIGLLRDGVDLGWRANEAGWSVLTAPNAAIEHRQVGRWGDRPQPLGEANALDRRMATRVVAAHSDHPARAGARLRAGSLFGSMGYLIGKDLERMRGHWQAFRHADADTRAAVEAHSRATSRQEAGDGVAKASRELVGGLLPSRTQSLRLGIESVADSASNRVSRRDDTDTSIDDLTGDDFAGKGRVARALSPLALAGLLVFLATLFSARNLGGLSALVGPELPPAPRSLADAWSAWLRPSPGVAGTPAPWLLLMALGSTLTIGNPEIFVSILIVFGPLLAMLTAYRLATRLTTDRWRAGVAALVWGLSLPALGVTGGGSVGATIAGILLPAWATSVRSWLTDDDGNPDAHGPDGWRAPSMLALLTVVIGSCYPAMWVATLSVAVVAVVRNRPWPPALLAVLAPVLAAGGWLEFLVQNPGRLLTGTDPTYAQPNVGAGLLASWVPLWLVLVVFVVVWLLGLARCVDASRFRLAQAGVAGASLVGTLAGVLVPRIVVDIDGVQARPDAAMWLLIGLGGMLVLSASGADEGGPRRWVASVGLGVIVAPMAAWWLWAGLSPLHRTSGPLPGYVQSAMAAPRLTRVMLVDLRGGEATWSVESRERPRWGSGEHNPISSSPQTYERLSQVAQQVVRADPGDDFTARLADAGIGYLWVRGGGVDLTAALGAAGLSPAELDGPQANTTLWLLDGLPSRAVVRSADQSTPVVDSSVPAGSGRQLVLAEPPDRRWRAELNGRQLPASPDGTPQFSLPDAAGRLTWAMAPAWGFAVVQVLVVAGCVIMAAPPVKPSGSTARRAL